MTKTRVLFALAASIATFAACPDPGKVGAGPEGLPNAPSATDIDGDGVANGVDNDVDGDGEPNATDPDIDDDGVINDQDDDADGDGIAGGEDDTDRGAGDQIGPHGDVDGDGTPNHQDGDNDNDGIPDSVRDETDAENSDEDGYCFDPEGGYYPCDDGAEPGSGGADGAPTTDLDGDGIPNDQDPDRDGDGEVNIQDPTPDGTFEPPVDETPPGDDTPPGGDQPLCVDETFAISTADPRIMLVVDRSGSMDQEADGYPGTKWTAAVDALSQVVTSLDQDIEFGLMLYPRGSNDDEVCQEGDVEEPIEPQNANDVVSRLQGTGPGGGTPTAPTLRAAKEALDALPAEGGKRVVVVATDGAPNCNLSLDLATCQCTSPNGCDNVRNCLDDQGSFEAAAALNAAGYPLFVVGIPGVESFEHVLNGMAQAGGTAVAGARQYYDASSADALATALENVAERVAACRFDLAAPVQNTSDVVVSSGGNTVPRDPGRLAGWDLVDPDTIELFGAACASVVGSQTDVTIHYCHAP